MIKLPKRAVMKTLPIYPGEVILTTDKKSFCKIHKQLGGDLSPADLFSGAASKFTHKGQAYYLIGVFNPSFGTYVHEVTHTALHVMEHAEMWIEPENHNEHFVYLHEYLFNMFLTEMTDYIQTT